MKKWKMRFGGAALTGVLLVQLTAGAFAAQAQAQIGSVTYSTLSEALEKAENGDTIEVLTDISNAELTKLCDTDGTYNITLDLNGHTISESTANSPTITFAAGNVSTAPSLTIRDGTLINTAVCESTPYGSGIWVESLENQSCRPIVKLTNVTVSSKYDAGINCIDAYVQINGAQVSGYDDAIYVQDGQVDIYSGSFSCSEGSDVSNNGALACQNETKVVFTAADGVIPTNWEGSTSFEVTAFNDVLTDDWYYEAVYALTEDGIINGSGNVWTFAPGKSITRAEFTKLLAAMSGESLSGYSGSSTFSDCAQSAWYNTMVGWGAAKGIINGCGDGTFEPDRNITRQEIAVMLLRYQEAVLGDTLPEVADAADFADADSIADWALDSVMTVSRQGIINGSLMKDGTILMNPDDQATRAEAAQMLYNMLQAIADA